MNVVLYCRFSSHNQNEQSIEGQLKECRLFAERNNFTIIGEYIDRALSGTTDNRPEFLRMIEDSSKKHFEGVIVYQLDRFARNRYDSATYKAKLKKNGVRVYSARENISDDASGVLMEAVLEGMAEYFSRELSQKVKRGMRLSAAKCQSTGTRIALGYYVDKDKHFQIDEQAAAIVKQIFEMYASGQTVTQIITYFNAKQIKTSIGGEFNKNSLRKMLRNKKYIGTYSYSDIIIENGIPRIISDELFNKVQEIMTMNVKAPARARAKEEYILTTKLFCGHCREMMTGAGGTSKTGKAYHYYACNKAKKKQCDKKQVGKKYIEDIVIAKCRELLTDENIEMIAKAVVELSEKERDNSNLKRLQKLLKDNERKQANLTQAVAECDIESVRKTLYAELNNLGLSHTELDKQITLEEVAFVKLTMPQIKFFLTQIKKGSADDTKFRKILVTVLINSIYLYDDKITFIINTGGQPVTIDEKLLNDIEQAAECSFIDSSAVPKLHTL